MTVLFHCPYCGTKVNDNESYCIKCGKHLPEDMYNRLAVSKQTKKVWFLPLIIVLLLGVSVSGFYLFLENQAAQAKELYSNGEMTAQKGDYEKARELFNEALEQKGNFPQASTAVHFMDIAISVQSKLDHAAKKLAKQEYKEALSELADTETELKNYDGSVVKKLVNEIVLTRSTIKIDQLKSQLAKEPTTDELKGYLWEAESIKNSEAEKITETIRNQIIDYTYSKASEALNRRHFSDAQALVSEGQIYAPESDKLKSLQTAIDNEKVAFETAQQRRIESALNTAAQERKQNKNDAVKLVNVKLLNNEQDKLIVKGKVKSIATIPINTILVEYNLLTKKGKEFKSNQVYVYPDTLYPNETGEFEFTHFDIINKAEELDVKVTKIKWYTEK
ncbi:zinc-ribbon domain-containing protein [Virgibacillus flavescens]|uniref:zinc-ribbon domain-containing protein n=1 Tax=Virgibacillus flavescens TaxID=1611422 RepID=UPI003D335A2C